MQWKDLKPVVGKSAPLLGALLGGPAGAAVGSMIAKQLGVPDDPRSVESELVKDPAFGAKLAELASAERVRLAELAATNLEHSFSHEESLAKLGADDRNSARNREVQLKDRMPAVLAIIVTIGFFSILWYLAMSVRAERENEAVLIMLGSLSTAWTAVISYYFGTTAGSREKNKLLAASTPQQVDK